MIRLSALGFRLSATLVLLVVMGGSARADITSNLPRHYNLDEGIGTNAADSGSDASAGTLTNGPTWSTGKIGPFAVAFDGSNDTIITGSAVTGAAVTDQLTLAAWSNLTNASTYRTAISNVDSGGTVGGFELITEQTTGKVMFIVIVPSGRKVLTGNTSVTGAWRHICGVYNGTDMRIYRDGVLDCTPLAVTGNLVFTSVLPLRIGTRSGGVGFPWIGSVDDVRVYARALSAGEVTELHAFTGVKASLRYYYRTSQTSPLKLRRWSVLDSTNYFAISH